MKFNEPYNKKDFINFINILLPDFIGTNQEINLKNNKSKIIKHAQVLGVSKELGNTYVLEFSHEKNTDPRVSITIDAFRIMNEHRISRCIAIFKNNDSNNYRLSLLTRNISIDDKNKIVKNFSDARRYSFYLGEGSKIKTPEFQLIKKGKVKDFEDLKERFSLEIVNKEFYKEIANLFDDLLNNNKYTFQYPKEDLSSRKSFIVRMIGRLIFCWFLKHKDSDGAKIIPDKVLSSSAVSKNYFHETVEILFFEILNKPLPRMVSTTELDKIPYLNGGLFYAQEEDFYQLDESKGKSIYEEKINVSENWFKDLFEILEKYNFTIDENMPFDQEVAIDPEMLGKIFENLLEELDEKKKTGSVYTPREIVDYIVDSCLVQYFSSNTTLGVPKIEALVSYDLNDDLEFEFSDEEKIQVIEAVDSLKILDPACGSGAFPIGLLQKLLFILNQIDSDGTLWMRNKLKSVPELYRARIERDFNLNHPDYIRKLEIIKNTIFGIDIQPIAVDISKLRCFLTLVVDANVIEPLPNLDFKFVCANGIVNAPSNESPLLDSLENTKLENLISSYFGASLDGKLIKINEIRDEIDNIISGNLKTIKNKSEYSPDKRFDKSVLNKKEIEENQRIVNLWNSYKNIFKNKPVDFFDIKYFFPSVKEGFDIIIGNPPYIGEKGHRDLFEAVKNSEFGKKYYLGKMDYFYFFFHRGIDLLKDGGVLGFITTNYFITATGAKKLILDFKERITLLKFVNLNEYKIFESAKGQHNMITFLKKGKYNLSCKIISTKEKGNFNSTIFNSIISGNNLNTNYFETPEDELFNNNTINLVVDSYKKIIKKIIINSLKLKDITNINAGIQTGADKVTKSHLKKYAWKIPEGSGIFVLSKSEAKNINKDIIKPWFKNSDVKKYSTSVNNNEYVIYLDSKTEDKDILNHLDKFKDNLIERREVHNGVRNWYELWWPRKRQIFEGEKIVAPQRSKSNTFGYNNVAWFASVDVYFITNAKHPYTLKMLLGILNSKLVLEWLHVMGKRKGAMLELYQEPLSNIPIPEFTNQNKEIFLEIEELTSKIIEIKSNQENSDTRELETKIDKLVYKLYEINDEEIKEIEILNNE